jgi:hypothetical protein
MTKTVKEIVDEYLNRQTQPKFESITFETINGRIPIETHSDVSNIYRDGIKITELELDNTFHKYQLDRAFDKRILPNAKPLRVTFRGKIIDFRQELEE